MANRSAQPRRHRMRQHARRESARAWVASGAPVRVKAFARRYGVDCYTAYADLIAIGFRLAPADNRWAVRPGPTPKRPPAEPADFPTDFDEDWVLDRRPTQVRCRLHARRRAIRVGSTTAMAPPRTGSHDHRLPPPLVIRTEFADHVLRRPRLRGRPGVLRGWSAQGAEDSRSVVTRGSPWPRSSPPRVRGLPSRTGTTRTVRRRNDPYQRQARSVI
jgi:hypothetical protein